MSNKSFDYNDVLRNLRLELDAKMQEVEKIKSAIFAIEPLAAPSNSTITVSVPEKTVVNSHSPNIGVYEGAVLLLFEKGKPLSNTDIYDGLLEKGIIREGLPRQNVTVTLYKSVRKKKEPKIKLIGTGTWDLVSR